MTSLYNNVSSYNFSISAYFSLNYLYKSSDSLYLAYNLYAKFNAYWILLFDDVGTVPINPSNGFIAS